MFYLDSYKFQPNLRALNCVYIKRAMLLYHLVDKKRNTEQPKTMLFHHQKYVSFTIDVLAGIQFIQELQITLGLTSHTCLSLHDILYFMLGGLKKIFNGNTE